VGLASLSFHFCHDVAEGWGSPSEHWLALVEITLTLLLLRNAGAGVGDPDCPLRRHCQEQSR